MRRFATSATLLTIILAILGGGMYWWQVARYRVSTNNAYIHAEITTVSSRLDGYIDTILVQDNQRVSKGDLLATIDSQRFQARLQIAQARLMQSESMAQNLQARKTLQLSLISEAQAEVDSRQAEVERLGQVLTRLRSLREQDYAALDALDQQETMRKSAIAQLAKARAQLDAQRAQSTVLDSEQLGLDAQINQDRAQLALARIDLENTQVRSPVNGIVGKRSLRPGQYVQEATPLLLIVPHENIWVEANFKETQLEHVWVGQKAILEFDAFPGQLIESTVDSLSPATGARFSLLPPENATGNFTKIVQRVPVRINIPPAHPLAKQLFAGMSVVVTVDSRH